MPPASTVTSPWPARMPNARRARPSCRRRARAGVRIGAACEFGLCGTCKVMKVSGEVDMNHNGGILDDEIDEGYILACCSKALSAIEIEA